MSPEIILLNILKVIPDGKTVLPIELVVNKMGSSTIIDLRIKIQKGKKK